LKNFQIIDKSKANIEAINMTKELVNSENLKYHCFDESGLAINQKKQDLVAG